MELRKLTYDEIIQKYNEVISKEYDKNGFSAFYITDSNDNKKPYKLKWLCTYLFYPVDKNSNGKYEVNNETKETFKKLLINTFNKENIYKLF